MADAGRAVATGGLEEKAEVTDGALPDMLTFTPDCSTILTANEGEAGEDPDGTFVNPEGSVSIISVAGALAGEVWPARSSACFVLLDAFIGCIHRMH